MNQRKNFQAFICVSIATVLALTTHIYVLEWAKPILDTMAQGMNVNPDSSNYPPIIMYSAYATAFFTVGLLVFFYYHAQHLIPGKSNLMKVLLVTAILLGLKGELVRQPLMDLILNYTLGMEQPFLFVSLNHVDRWLANLLLAVCLVYLCPRKEIKASQPTA
ncbi:MAG: hypothetical protein ABFQ95_04380 [Pseudomonadota bacterium]